MRRNFDKSSRLERIMEAVRILYHSDNLTPDEIVGLLELAKAKVIRDMQLNGEI